MMHILLGIIEAFDEAISNRMRHGHVAMVVAEVESIFGQGVLDMVHDRRLDRQDVDWAITAHQLPKLLIFYCVTFDTVFRTEKLSFGLLPFLTGVLTNKGFDVLLRVHCEGEMGGRIF